MKHKPNQQLTVPPTDLSLLTQLELVPTFDTGSALLRYRRFSTIGRNRWQQFCQPSYISEFLIFDTQPRAKCGAFALRKKLLYVVCVVVSRTRGHGVETSTKAMDFWKSGFKFAFRRNKKGKVFGILSQLKKLSKPNDVHAQNKTFLAAYNELLIAAENSRYRRRRHYVYSLMGSYVY